jgi:lysosomal alpha-mannosidase
LIRFEHLLEKNEDPVYSQPTKFNIQDIFRTFDVDEIRETTLSGNQWLNDAKRMKFQPDPAYSEYVNLEVQNDDVDVKPVYNVEKQNPNLDPSCVLNGYSDMMNQATRTLGFDYEITMQPMQIRTFVVTLAQKV